ncbi:MAG: FTR1 family protein [Gemmatimonadota bacterium]
MSISILTALVIGAANPARQVPAQSQVATTTQDVAQVTRRLWATAQLGAQEYQLGVKNGAVVSAEELAESQLFFTEARRTAGLLPFSVSGAANQQVAGIIQLVERHADPDSVSAAVNRLGGLLTAKLNIALEDIPALTPSLARGAQVYQANCAACHGLAGRGDGPAAAGLNPPPANLSAASQLTDRSPLDFYHRITIGVGGTAMPAYESQLSAEDRWAAAGYATILRLPAPRGEIPTALRTFATTAKMSDQQIFAALPPSSTPADAAALLSAVRSYQVPEPGASGNAAVFAKVNTQLDSALSLAKTGQWSAASGTAFDAYMTFEGVEVAVRSRNPTLASDLESAFAAFRTRASGGATPAELQILRGRLASGLENAERSIADRMSPANLFTQSFVILVREGFEAILIIGALLAFLTKTGQGHRRRDIHIGVGAAVGVSLLTALLLETLIEVSPGHREALEGATMLVAMAMLFYVSYWLLSKMEVAKWNRFVKSKVQDALSSGSALALVSVAFLAVYREGFETILFYKALFVAGGSSGAAWPVIGGIVAGSVVLSIAYFAINRFGVKLPLKPFFGVTSAFLYYMAFVFAGKGIAELQEGGLMSTTILPWGPRMPALGIYPTVESLALQAVLLALFAFALLWTFVIEPRRLKVTSVMVPEPGDTTPESVSDPVESLGQDGDLVRSLERMDADLAEMRSEIARIKRRMGAAK